MFNRANRQTRSFSDYANAVAGGLKNGSGTIGSARTTLLNKADEIDAGPLHVDDNWVVMIDQAIMSAEQAAALLKQAQADQATVNEMLLAVGDADDETAAAAQAAGKDFGYVMPDMNLLGGLPPPPANEVPNPRWPDGLIQQDIIRKNDMAMSVREETVKYTEDDQVVTTLIMQDGSKHVIHEWGDDIPHVSDAYYDKDGNFISSTMSFTNPFNNSKVTEIQWGDGTVLTMSQAPDGTVTGGVTTADGRDAPVPPEFFSHPALTTVQGRADPAGQTSRERSRYSDAQRGTGGERRQGRPLRRPSGGCRHGALGRGHRGHSPRCVRRHVVWREVKSIAAAICGLIFCAGIGTLCAAWAVVTLLRGEFLTTTTVLGFAVMLFGFAVWLSRMRWGNLTAAGEFDATGTTVRPDRAGDLLIRIAMISGVLAMSLFAVLWPLGKLDIPVPHSMRYYLPVMSTIGALAGAPVLWRAMRRGSMSYLRLTPDGFEFAEGRSPAQGQWGEVEDVSYRPPEGPEPKANSIVFVMSDGKTPTLVVSSYTPEGRAVRKMVRFYWKHPENRDELTDGRAIERLRAEDFERRRQS